MLSGVHRFLFNSLCNILYDVQASRMRYVYQTPFKCHDGFSCCLSCIELFVWHLYLRQTNIRECKLGDSPLPPPSTAYSHTGVFEECGCYGEHVPN